MSASTETTISYGTKAGIAFVKHPAGDSRARYCFPTTSRPFDGARDDT